MGHARVVQWFHDNHFGVLVGFAIMFVITGMTTMSNALIAYSMRACRSAALSRIRT